MADYSKMTEMERLTDEAKSRYIDAGGTKCPYCGSVLLIADRLDTGGSVAWGRVRCDMCERRWTDVFTLTGIEDDGDEN